MLDLTFFSLLISFPCSHAHIPSQFSVNNALPDPQFCSAACMCVWGVCVCARACTTTVQALIGQPYDKGPWYMIDCVCMCVSVRFVGVLEHEFLLCIRQQSNDNESISLLSD